MNGKLESAYKEDGTKITCPHCQSDAYLSGIAHWDWEDNSGDWTNHVYRCLNANCGKEFDLYIEYWEHS